MNFLKRLFGQNDDHYRQPTAPYRSYGGGQRIQGGQVANHYGVGTPASQLNDEQALARYRYMLRTAPPDAIEQAHAEAFSKLTPEQRALALRELANQAPEHERNSSEYTRDDPQTLARLATRTEMRQPGTLERTFGQSNYGQRGGIGMGGGMGIGGTIMTGLAAGFVGSMIADQLFNSVDPSALAGDYAQEMGMDPGMVEEGMAGEGFAEEGAADSGDWGTDSGGDDFGGGFDTEF